MLLSDENILSMHEFINSKPSYSFWVGVGVAVAEELVKNDSKTPDIWLVGESGLIDGLWGIPVIRWAVVNLQELNLNIRLQWAVG